LPEIVAPECTLAREYLAYQELQATNEYLLE
jgi:hypothetical protein